jgi:hypothetical protein
MLARQHFLHLTESIGEARRPPLFAVRHLHERAVGATHFLGVPPAVKVCFGLFLARLVGTRREVPRCRVAVSVFTPSGMPAVKMRS